MANKSTKAFEELIAQVDKLPNDMPQDYKYRKKKNGTEDASSERAPVKLSSAGPSVNSKHQNIVNNLVETNNRFQTTQNHIVQQQTEVNKDQLDQDRKQTGLLQQQHQTMQQMSTTMDKLYLMMKHQNDKITPKIQERAAANDVEPNFGTPKNSAMDSIGDLIGGLMGGGLDILGGRRGREKVKPTRQERADKRAQRRAGGRAGGGRMGRMASSAASIYDKVKGMTVNGAARAGGAVRTAAGTHLPKMGGRWGRAGAIVAGGATALLGGKALYDAGFGSVSEKYESGGNGVDTVSTGKGDHGGVSYGKHQLSSKSGTMSAFLNSPEAEKFKPYFEGLTPGSAQFNSVYSKLATDHKEEFGFAQQNFIQRTHYDPAMRKLQKNGIDFENRSRALNELVFSTATQYGAGGAPNKIMRALEGMDVNSMSDEQIITAIQDNKSANVATDFRKSSYETQQSVAARAQREKADLLAMVQAEKDAKAGIDREEVNRIQGKTAEGEVAAQTESSTPMVLADGTEPAVAPSAPIGVLPMTPGDGTSMVDPVSGLMIGGGLLAGGAAAIKSRRGATIADPTSIQGREALPPRPTDVIPENESRAARSAREAMSAGRTAKAAERGLIKGVPVVGTVLTAADAALIMTDDTMTTEEKTREGVGLVGGTAGAIAGGKAGAVGGAAVGAGIGAFFFGAGAVPGAAIGGAIGGIGGSIAGYMGGEYIAKEGYDAVDGAINPATGEPVVNAGEVKPSTPFVAPSSPVGIFPMAQASNLAAPTKKGNDVPAPLLAAAKTAMPTEAVTSQSQSTELATAAVKGDQPQAVELQQGKTTLMVVPIAMPAKVDTDSAKQEVASTPKKAEPVAAAPTQEAVTVGSQSLMPAVNSAVDKAPAFIGNTMNSVSSAVTQLTGTTADAAGQIANSVTPMLSAATTQASPITQSAPAPKRTAASWSPLAQATPQRVEKVSAAHEVPMAREAFTSVQPVNVENQSSPAAAFGAPQRIQGSGIAESNSVRPELKDVPPFITDFGIVFLNAGII